MTAEEIRRLLGLEPLPGEGGYFAETWRSALRAPAEAQPGHGTDRALATAIYYLVTPESFSAMHRVRSDEIFHFYLGDAVEMLQLHPDGRGRVLTLGSRLADGERPQVVVPADVWQGTRLRAGGVWALLGTVVAPGFEFADYEQGERAALVAGWPEWRGQIETLTRS
jgi:predicted cupin superfamily sugar epimerase